jgi:hypothetical protein
MAMTGPIDNHCMLDAGGTATTVDPSACTPPDANVDGGSGCPYGATNFNLEANDDDCKYHVKWSSTPICEGDGSAASPGVRFAVTATYLVGGAALTGANTMAEVFVTTPGDQDSAMYCDNATTHPGPQPGLVPLAEDTTHPGTYSGLIQFDQPGAWTVRFHFHEECYDVPSSPHGHAAFHITVP